MVELLLPIPMPDDRRGEYVAGFVIHGEPQRSKHLCTCRGKHPSTRPDPGWERWRNKAVEALAPLRRLPPIDYPICAQVVAVFARPKGRKTRYTLGGVERPYPWAWTSDRVRFIGTPDADQVQKAGVDVLVQAGILLDDSLVEPIGTPRWYAAEGEEPRTEVRFWRSV